MKTIIFFFIILLSTSMAQSKTIVISDIDDTIKLSNIRANKIAVVFRGLFSAHAFSAMNTLYNEFEDNQMKLFYVSGSPKIIGMKVTRFLEKHQFPQSENLVLRENLKVNTKGYKLKNIKKIIEEEQPETILLIGDDTEYDPEIFYEIYKLYPELVKGIYIRLVANDQIMPDLKAKQPKVIQTFFTATELAFWEQQKQRISLEGFVKVSNSFRNLKDDEGYSLPNRYCPEKGSPSVDEMVNQIKESEVELDLEKLIQLNILNETQKIIKEECKVKPIFLNDQG